MHPGLKLPIVCVITPNTTAVPLPGNCTQTACSLNATVCDGKPGFRQFCLFVLLLYTMSENFEYFIPLWWFWDFSVF